MERIWDTLNREICLDVEIICTGECLFRVVATDDKPNSKYAERTIKVDGYRKIYLSFPVTPKQMKIKVDCLKSASIEKNFIVNVSERKLTKYDVFFDQNTKDFLPLAIYFSQVAGFENASVNGRLFRTKDGKFTIKYFPQIVDYKSGAILSTPARIGHRTGIIEDSKKAFDKYTVAMRMIINLHEFSHVYKNPKMGLNISNEIGADINALYIYLGLGFSKVDAIYVFANVFLKAQTPQNIQRMSKIMEYIKRFENEEYAKIIK